MAHAEPATATLASKSPITSLVIDFIALDLLLYQTLDTGKVFAGWACPYWGLPSA
jgi:hypothetical protein